MPPPPIQYARTKDGVDIAYWTLGEGPPLVFQPILLVSHVQDEWVMPGRREVYERLSSRSTLVRYDPRGMGMSERDVGDYSLESALLDLEAVVDRLGFSTFAFANLESAGAVAFAYAATHPDRVSHLVHTVRPVRMVDPTRLRDFRAIRVLMDDEWELYTRIVARLLTGWDSPDATALASIIAASHTPDSIRRVMKDLSNDGRGEFLGQIRVPTLIIYPSTDEASQRIARSLTAAIKSASVMGIPGEWPLGPFSNEAGVHALLDFINSSPSAPGAAIAAPELDTSVFRAIVWTDLVDHTPMMQRLGDVKGRDVLREHERVTREALRDHGGEEVKSMGDGFMASFPSVQRALECSGALQETFASQEIAGERLRCRIGINAGEPIVEDGDLFGHTVITAARIASHAEGGEVLVADVVRQLVAGKGFTFEDRGEQALKGLSEPVRLWSVV